MDHFLCPFFSPDSVVKYSQKFFLTFLFTIWFYHTVANFEDQFLTIDIHADKVQFFWYILKSLFLLWISVLAVLSYCFFATAPTLFI